ncbi:MAG: glycosyltransferase, partial [Thermodesulfobacteriota bacterium]
LLPYSVGSILNQTIKDIEVFIIGDGVYDETRKIIHELMEKDERVRFFDHPKHERRGELYRHEALQQAHGKIVCYLCDRDLMLDFHIENLLKYYEKYNFVTSHCFNSLIDGLMDIGVTLFVGEITNKERKLGAGRTLPGTHKGFRLSTLSHSLDLYKKLPFGWRTTPSSTPTDHYMYEQFLAHTECMPFFSIYPPSILYIRRGAHHNGWSTSERLKEIMDWSDFLKKENYLNELKEFSLKGLVSRRNSLWIENEYFKRKIFNSEALISFGKKINRTLRKFVNLFYFR